MTNSLAVNLSQIASTLPNFINAVTVLSQRYVSKARLCASLLSAFALRMIPIFSAAGYGTIVPKGIVRFRSCNKAVVNVFPHKAEPSCATRTGQYLLGR